MIHYVVLAVDEGAVAHAVFPEDLVAHVVAEGIRKVLAGRPVTPAVLDSLRVEVVRHDADDLRRPPSPLHDIRVTVNS